MFSILKAPMAMYSASIRTPLEKFGVNSILARFCCAPIYWSFLFLVGISVFILRFKHPNTKRDFSVPLYPLTPIVFCASCAYLAYSSFAYAHSKGAVTISLYVMLVGVIALLFLRAKKAAQ